MDEAKIVVLEGPIWLPGAACGRQTAQALGFQDAVDRVSIEMRQKVANHKGEVIQRKARGTTQSADNGALLFGGFPRQLVRAAGVVLAVGRTALAPLADRLGRDAIALRQDTGWLPRSRNLGADIRGVATLKSGPRPPVGPRDRAISARTAGVVRAFGCIVRIPPSSLEQPWQAHQTAKHRPQSPNDPDPNNVPPPNT